MSDCAWPNTGRAFLPEAEEIFHRHQASLARSQQMTLGPSEIGHPCDLQLIYKLTRTPPAVDEGLKWAPLVGTWGHSGAETALRQENQRLGRERFIVEQHNEIHPDLIPDSATDLYDVDYEEVIDWKFIGESSMRKYRSKGPSEVYKVQVQVYGYGWARLGRAVRSVRIVFLPKWSSRFDDGYEWVDEYRESVATEALARLETLNASAALVGHGLATYADIARDTTECRFCPYLRRGGPPDRTGCHGWYQSSSFDDLVGPVGQAQDRLMELIREAPHREALGALWLTRRAEWAPEHTAEAKRRLVEIGEHL